VLARPARPARSAHLSHARHSRPGGKRSQMARRRVMRAARRLLELEPLALRVQPYSGEGTHSGVSSGEGSRPRRGCTRHGARL
jgi:hypothetical protein